MKNIINYLTICIMLILASCDSLDIAPEDYYAEGNFWKNESQVNGFMSGMHTSLRNKANTFFLMGEQRGDLFIENGTFGTGMDNVNMIIHNLKESSPGFSNWDGFYGNLVNVNMFIYKVENGLPFLSKEKTDFYLGQAHGIRAYYYFYMLRTWGGVPLVTEPKVATGATSPNELYTARSTEAEILDFLKKEINLSESYFKDDNFTLTSKRETWSKAATLMLKAEIYLWAAKVKTDENPPASPSDDLTTAAQALTAVEASGKFGLLSSFQDIFAYNNKGNNEIILTLHYEKGEAEQNLRRFMYDIPMMASWYDKEGIPMNDPLNVGDRCILANEYKWDLFESYDENDTRKYTTFMDFYNQDKTQHGVVLRKFLGTVDNNIRNYSDDMPLYRYADLLLMRAEIKNMQGSDPSVEINKIRERAYTGNAYPSYTNKSFAENELAILSERDKEFVREGKRWFDVRRMHDASGNPLAFTQSGLSQSEAYKLLWPIDTGTMTKDPLVKQTEGY